jgi:hypothetical protein
MNSVESLKAILAKQVRTDKHNEAKKTKPGTPRPDLGTNFPHSPSLEVSDCQRARQRVQVRYSSEHVAQTQRLSRAHPWREYAQR